ncbi:MAG TPA: hypothetical protein VGL57_05590 [Solirubrobacteraceae bacterium]|jgi:hypothetical protein
MEAIFPFVVYGGIALFVLVGVLSMLSRNNNLYDQIGQGGLTLGEDRTAGRGHSAPAEPGDFDALAGLESAHRAEREQEIRQMLQARSDRRVRSGDAPLDIDAELAKLERTQHFGSAPLGPTGEGPRDSGLAIEVRQLVLARNERRLRQGQPALDIEAEVARTLAEFGS